ncbi:unnamed protein product [Brachionus calyciflorus]|uniref:Uncharacterized protein n=1 Tax=Brachionus calyciflorus TaxID=104777 RepID=A0A814QV06_9BILA|nr:unnamed protein product [Brachionus calyciflorus]
MGGRGNSKKSGSSNQSQQQRINEHIEEEYSRFKGVDVSIDVEDEQFIQIMEKNYQIYDIKRITKKSLNNKPLPVLRA